MDLDALFKKNENAKKINKKLSLVSFIAISFGMTFLVLSLVELMPYKESSTIYSAQLSSMIKEKEVLSQNLEGAKSELLKKDKSLSELTALNKEHMEIFLQRRNVDDKRDGSIVAYVEKKQKELKKAEDLTSDKKLNNLALIDSMTAIKDSFVNLLNNAMAESAIKDKQIFSLTKYRNINPTKNAEALLREFKFDYKSIMDTLVKYDYRHRMNQAKILSWQFDEIVNRNRFEN